jgi:hypothetical protein
VDNRRGRSALLGSFTDSYGSEVTLNRCSECQAVISSLGSNEHFRWHEHIDVRIAQLEQQIADLEMQL